MPEANISPPTDEETTKARSAPADTGEAEPEGEPGPEAGPEPGEEQEQEPSEQDAPAERTGLTPKQARRVRIIVSGVVMAAVAVALVVRFGSAPSVLTVGFYGIALILSGTAIVLSRRGRTRVATGVLVLGFAAVALAEWLLASVQ